MVAQVAQFQPIELELIHSGIDDLTYDDLADLQRDIADLFRQRDRGDDISSQLAKVQNTVKDLAIGFGVVSEIFALQDEQLKRCSES